MDKNKKPIEERSSVWGNKTIAMMFVLLLGGSNALNRYVSNQEKNTLQIIYDKERSDKKDERVLEQAETLILINNYDIEVARLKRLLDECKK